MQDANNRMSTMPQERQDRIKAETDRLAALDELARLGQEYDAETEAGGSIIQGLREAMEYTKGMLADVKPVNHLLIAAKRYDAANDAYDEDSKDAMDEWRAARLALKAAIKDAEAAE